MGPLLTAWLATAQAGHPAGTPLDAIALDVTPEGMALVEPIAQGIVPPTLEVPGFSDSSSPCLFGYTIDVYGMVATATVDAVDIVPTDEGRIQIDLAATISLNSPDDPFTLFTELICIEDTCDAWIDPFQATVSTSIGFALVPDGYGGTTVVSDTDPLSISHGLSGGDIGLEGCVLGDLSFLLDLFLPLLDDALLGAVAGLETEVDAAVADAMASASFADVVEVTDGVALDIAISVESILVDSQGLRVVVGGSAASTAVAECVAAYDPGESLATPSAPPAIGAVPVGGDAGFHIGAHISDDFANQALYAVWQSGLLCQTVDEDLLGDSLPLAFDTSLLSLLVPGVYDEVFPDPAPVEILTRPETPPTFDPAGPAVNLEGFGLEIYAEIDDRMVLLTDVALGLSAGLNPTFDPLTGAIGFGVDLSDGVDASVLRNEYAPGSDEAIESGLGGLLSNPLISGLLAGALEGLAVSIPTLTVDGVTFGLTDMQVGPSGPSEDFLGLTVWAGEVEYVSAGGCGGCGETGTSSGCTGTTGTTGAGCTIDTAACIEDSGCTGSSSYSTGSSCDCEEATVSGSGTTGGCGCGVPLFVLDGRFIAIGFAAMVVRGRRRHRS